MSIIPSVENRQEFAKSCRSDKQRTADSVEKVATLFGQRQNCFIGRLGITQHDGTAIDWAGAAFVHLEDHIPANHLLRSIDQSLDLSDLRHHLADFYTLIERPSIDPELMIRMLIV